MRGSLPLGGGVACLGIGGHVAAARNGDTDRVVSALGGEILVEKVAQTTRLDTHQRVGRRIEFRIPAEHVDGDGKALQPLRLAGLLLLDEIMKKLSGTLGASEGLTGKQFFESLDAAPLLPGRMSATGPAFPDGRRS